MIEPVFFRPNMDSQEENMIETMKKVNEIVLAINVLLRSHDKAAKDFKMVRELESYRAQHEPFV